MNSMHTHVNEPTRLIHYAARTTTNKHRTHCRTIIIANYKIDIERGGKIATTNTSTYTHTHMHFRALRIMSYSVHEKQRGMHNSQMPI